MKNTELEIEYIKSKNKFLLSYSIAATILALLVFTVFAAFQHNFEKKQQTINTEFVKLKNENESIKNELKSTKEKLQKYELDEKYLMSIGASENLARITIKAARAHPEGLSPKN